MSTVAAAVPIEPPLAKLLSDSTVLTVAPLLVSVVPEPALEPIVRLPMFVVVTANLPMLRALAVAVPKLNVPALATSTNGVNKLVSVRPEPLTQKLAVCWALFWLMMLLPSAPAKVQAVPFQITDALVPVLIVAPSKVKLTLPILLIYSMRPAVAEVGLNRVIVCPAVVWLIVIYVYMSTDWAAVSGEPGVPPSEPPSESLAITSAVFLVAPLFTNNVPEPALAPKVIVLALLP